MSLLMQNMNIQVDGVAHLNDVSLEFKPGRLYTILGRTLAGKTTLLRTIAGLQSPQKGTLTLHGQNYLNLPVWKRRVAMVYQQFINYPHLDVLANVAFPLRRAGVSPAEARQRAREILFKVGLANFENRRPSSLSGGQQQRVALARALVKRAEILLLDEPLVNLDYKLREQLRDEFQNIFTGQDDAIVIYTTTEPDEAIQLGHELIVMNEGAVIQQGNPLGVFNAPATIRCAEIIYSPPMNIFNGVIQRGEIILSGGLKLPTPLALGQLPDGPYRFGLPAADITIGGDMAAEVELSEISGAHTILHLRGAIGSFIVYETGVCHYAMGSTVAVGIDPRHFFTFTVDGKLINPAAAATGQGR